jgi:hypothetical protein
MNGIGGSLPLSARKTRDWLQSKEWPRHPQSPHSPDRPALEGRLTTCAALTAEETTINPGSVPNAPSSADLIRE